MNATRKFSLAGHALLAVSALLVAGCGASGTGPAVGGISAGCDPDDPATASQCGQVLVALTDAEGDFASYTVDVLSISLERAGGSRVELLPQSTRVDFAQLTSLSELVSASPVPPGNFVSGRIRIDYSDADIYVEADGDIVPAEVYDTEGSLLTAATDASIVDVEVRLPASDRLIVTRGLTALLSIDFDLAASHLVDTTTNPVSAVAQPYFVAEVAPVDEKEMRVRGALVGVDPDAGTYDIRLRPWFHRGGDYGVFTVTTDDATEFDIDGVPYTGSAGLESLAAAAPGTVTVAFGTLDLNDRSFAAEIVHAGDSVGGDRYSAVLGNIVARTGDQLVMKGAVAIRRDRRSHFHRTVIVDLGPETAVSRQGQPNATLDKDELSVGQRTIVFGEITNPSIDNADRFGPDIALLMDATEGRARLLVTRLTGSLNSASPGLIEMQLRSIDRLSVSMFDFSGTGITADVDADPAAYQVATSTLPIDTLTVDRPVRVLGFVKAFGEAPPDFEGRTLIGPADLPAVLGVGWGTTGTAAPFSAMGATSLVIDLANPDIDERHHMLIGRERIDLFDLPASPSIEPSGPPRVYGIWEPGHVELFKDFGGFVDELALRLSDTDRARNLAAYGRFATATNSLTANKIVVHMLPAETP